MKTLYLSDLDGTLLNTRDEISPFTAQVVARMQQRGKIFSYATARSFSTASKVAAPLRIGLPVIVYNGAFIRRSDTGEVLASCRFGGGEADFLRQVFSDAGLFPLVYAFIDGAERVSFVPERAGEGMRHYLQNRRGDRRLRPVTGEEALYAGEIFYFTCIGERGALQPAYEAVAREGHFRCTLQQELYREEYWLEAMPAQATKAAAALRLKALLGCERLVAFGDAVNDLPLFEAADACYAVGNAVPQLKAAATGVIGSNDEDGVARWLLEHCLGA